MPKFSIRYNVGRSAKKPYQLDLGVVVDPVSKRARRAFLYFATETEAEEERAKRRREVKEFGRSALGFSEGQRMRYAEAEARLRKVGATIEGAVDFWERHHARIVEVISVAELVRRGTQALASYQSKEYMVAVGVAWRSFAERFGEMDAGAVTTEEVSRWLRLRAWALKTKKNYLSDLSMLFDWAAHPERGLAAANPCAHVELRGRVKKEEVSCMSPDQARRLMTTTRDQYPDFLGYVALGLFAGVRPKRERRGLTIEDIAAADGEASPVVAVGAHIAKGASRGTTALSPNLVAWLRKWQELCPWQRSVWPEHWEPRWMRLRIAAGWEIPWPRNIERHTFASMHYAAHHDLAKLKAALRHHDSEQTLHNHYKAVRMLDGRIVTATTAAEYWGIVP